MFRYMKNMCLDKQIRSDRDIVSVGWICHSLEGTCVCVCVTVCVLCVCVCHGVCVCARARVS
jgi:hypothetical protein